MSNPQKRVREEQTNYLNRFKAKNPRSVYADTKPIEAFCSLPNRHKTQQTKRHAMKQTKRRASELLNNKRKDPKRFKKIKTTNIKIKEGVWGN